MTSLKTAFDYFIFGESLTRVPEKKSPEKEYVSKETRYRILQKDDIFKVQYMGWFGWADCKAMSGLSLEFESVIYFPSFEEAERSVLAWVESDNKTPDKWTAL